MSELHYRFFIRPHPDTPHDRLLLICQQNDLTSSMPVPMSEADIIELHGVLERELRRRRAYVVQDNGDLQLCLPAAS